MESNIYSFRNIIVMTVFVVIICSFIFFMGLFFPEVGTNENFSETKVFTWEGEFAPLLYAVLSILAGFGFSKLNFVKKALRDFSNAKNQEGSVRDQKNGKYIF